jgi:predicted DNA-binding helix-hairpin-helix protein
MNHSQSIVHLDLSKRTIDALKYTNINCIKDLEVLSFKQLLAIPGLGKKAIIEIDEALIEYRKNNRFLLEVLNQKLNQINEVLEGFRPIIVQVMRKELTNLHMQVNELRTVILEQQPILESIQARNPPDVFLSEIDKKIPGFSRTIYDVYKTLKNN